MRYLVLFISSLLVGACVDSYRVGGGGDAAQDGAGNTGDSLTGDELLSGDPLVTGDPLSGGDPAPSPCPSTLPTTNDACSSVGLLCGYGNDPRDECNALASCTGSGWAISDPACTPPVIDPECPATLEKTAGEPCDDPTMICIFGEFSCNCTNCPPPQPMCGGETEWFCEQPHPDSECPVGRPLSGEPCSENGKVCEYLCGPGNSMTCVDNIWQQTNSPSCPISSRRFKNNIEYLAAEARQEIAEQTLSVRLAEYDYIGTIPARTRRLGFVIEDHPDLAAVAENGANIDLYAYTSMVLATVQVQAEQIAALRRELAELQARVADRNAALVCEPD